MTITDPILDSDLHAYVDDQLDVARRIQVETYLSEHPATAAKVMADLGLRGELRLALADQICTGRPETRDAARRLERGLSRGRIVASFRRIAAVAALIAVGWLAHIYTGPFGVSQVQASIHPPAYVEEALRAHRTARLREGMPSQDQVAAYNPEEIRAATAIVMPQLPKGWSVANVQIFPSQFGPSVEMAIVSERGERLSLFAVRPGSFTVRPVDHLSLASVEAAYWQIGDVAYALVSDSHGGDLDQTAARLARSLY